MHKKLILTIWSARLENYQKIWRQSFKQEAEYQVQLEQKIDVRFDKIEAEIGAVKVDMVAMKVRILDAFRQPVTIIDTRLSPLEK